MQTLRAIIAFIVLFGLYLLLSGSTGPAECAAGLGAACLALLPGLLAPHRRSRTLRLHPPLPAIIHPLIALPRDAIRILPALLRAIRRRPDGPVGSISRIPFRDGGETPDDAGRRGWVTLAASLAPNGFVLHLPDGEDTLVLHRLAPDRRTGTLDWPV